VGTDANKGLVDRAGGRREGGRLESRGRWSQDETRGKAVEDWLGDSEQMYIISGRAGVSCRRFFRQPEV
jgi:hypothetical protein